MIGGKVDCQILFGARSEKPKILFGARGEKLKIYLVPNDSNEKFYLAVKGLMHTAKNYKYTDNKKAPVVWIGIVFSII